MSGRVTGDDGAALTLEVNPVDPDASRKVPREQATALVITSQMLPGLANTFSQDEFLDLLAFMERGAK